MDGEQFTKPCGCICEYYDRSSERSFAAWGSDTIVRTIAYCEQCQIDKNIRDVEQAAQYKIDEANRSAQRALDDAIHAENRRIWNEHVAAVLNIEHKTLIAIPNRKELHRYGNILIVQKVRGRYYCSKERLDALDISKH